MNIIVSKFNSGAWDWFAITCGGKWALVIWAPRLWETVMRHGLGVQFWKQMRIK